MKIFGVPPRIATILVFVASAGFASANLITNGDFETQDFTGWTVTDAASGSNISVQPLPAPHDTFGAEFAATGADFDSISQTFATTPGAFYDLSFFYQVGDTQAQANNEMRVLFNGNVVFDNPNSNPGSVPLTFTNLQATGSATTVEFQGRNGPAADYIDDVSVTASVPEPGPAALILFGATFGTTAVVRRHRLA